MEIEKARIIFEELYKDIDGIQISLNQRNKLNLTSKELVYGEINFDSFIDLMKKIEPKEEDIFYDMGSGTGKPCIATALVFNVKKIVGYEILSDLVETANKVLKRLIDLNIKIPQVEFKNQNFLEADFSDGTIIFSHATCFEENTMKTFEEKLLSLNKGARIIIITKSLKSKDFSLIEEGEKRMSWGYATYRIYEKIS